MEFIHKAKAEKNRTKVLSDQMEARRVKNKVSPFFYHSTPPCPHVIPPLRLFANAVPPVLQRSARVSLLSSTKMLKSKLGGFHIHNHLELSAAPFFCIDLFLGALPLHSDKPPQYVLHIHMPVGKDYALISLT